MSRGLACLWSCLLALPAFAAESTPHGTGVSPAPQFTGIRVGLGDRYKIGVWTPVWLTIRGGRAPLRCRLAVTAPDGDGAPSRVVTPAETPLEIRPESETTAAVFVRFGRIESRLTAELLCDGQAIARRSFDAAASAGPDRFLPALDSGHELLVTVGANAMGVEEAAAGREQEADMEPVVVRLGSVEQLPTQWYGYEGVDALVLSTSRPAIYAAMSAAQVEALDRWIRMGGKLLLCAGAAADRALAPAAPLAQLAPGKFQESAGLQQTATLETYCGSAAPIPLDANAGEIRAARLSQVSGVVEVREADLPLVVRTPRGMGQVVFFAADLDRPPLKNWAAREALVRRLLSLTTTAGDEPGPSGAVMHYGFHDMAGQLRKALDQFPGVEMAPFWFIVLLACVYVLLIGPIDYLFLRKVAGRMTLTWISFPVLVAGVSLGAYFLATRLKGNLVRVSRAEMIDVDTTRGEARGTAWMAMFSPRPQHYDLAPRITLPDGAAAPAARVLLAWLGLPGNGLGGMSRSSGPAPLGTEAYGFSPALDQILGMPIENASTRILTVRWFARCKPGVEADLASREQILSGSISTALPARLSRCMLAYGNWAYDLGTLEPGGAAQLGPSTRRSQLRTYLTNPRIVKEAGDKYRQETQPYDPSNVDLPYILQAMMFFESGGGSRFTGLVNRYQPFIDLTGTLEAGRAVLVGFAEPAASPLPGTELCNGDRRLAQPDDTRVVVYRFVLPVKRVVDGGR
jgi:hypothetical protein